MKVKLHTVRGHRLPGPRATLPGLLWMAGALSVPVFVILSLTEIALRLLL